MRNFIKLSISSFALFIFLFFGIGNVHASEPELFEIINDETVETGTLDSSPAYVPITEWWYETLPMPYQGRHMYMQITRHGQCLGGYLGGRNVGGANFIYEGYLYPCAGPKPIPTLKPLEEEDE